ncbi:hypothetical protein DICPUDRAFT_75548 [Dictyostelium purpureum]|uniref:Band 7 domain-containing protein n=1 Tax=Dictyostelium purpureum TaxID=5786 RepID=F0ZAZ4_DICPU|nr:uncharacterized protein DICPUDRAFT_75548 [Dictyostelium purpureum]EGC38914.1 hypothetical protein DICPUDRAFT_75548 [Dictyostelium purpureum]|eukprot:XP_003284594.1 hypothetical protein DICPUDRAFT_75548 [Dictyostelium purpureum]
MELFDPKLRNPFFSKNKLNFFPQKKQEILVKKKGLLDNKAATSDEINLKFFQTRDSLRVGVVLVVVFKIVDPEFAITKLGKEGIINHIENVSFADIVQKNQAVIVESQAKPQFSQKKVEALLIATDAQRKSQEMQGEIFTKYPILAEIELAKTKAQVLKGATLYITPKMQEIL